MRGSMTSLASMATCALMLLGCADMAATPHPSSATADTASSSGGGSFYAGGDASSYSASDGTSSSPSPGSPPSVGGGPDAAADASGSADSYAAPDSGPSQGPSAGQLTAGVWDDLDQWDFYRNLFDDSAWADKEHDWGFDTGGRVLAIVKHDGDPVVDASVSLRETVSGLVVSDARTDNNGFANVFGDLDWPSDAANHGQAYELVVVSGTEQVVISDVHTSRHLGELSVHSVDLAHAMGPASTLDLMLVVDTTGSMGDELGYLQSELAWVLENVQAEAPQLSIRLSVNFYRDEGDAYLVRSNPFTTSLGDALGQLSAQNAGGGGDFPEAVDKALINAINQHSWSESAQARLLFLVLDAPPHHTQGVMQTLGSVLPAAMAQGIRIIPVTGSGIDKETEFLTRVMSITTGGKYVFLTNDSGIGGGHIESHLPGPTQTIGEVDIQPLNELLLDVIVDYAL